MKYWWYGFSAVDVNISYHVLIMNTMSVLIIISSNIVNFYVNLKNVLQSHFQLMLLTATLNGTFSMVVLIYFNHLVICSIYQCTDAT